MIHSFLLIGQSNMAGRGLKNEVEPIPNKNIYVLRNGRWWPMYVPVNPDRVTAGINLSETFAYRYLQDHLTENITLEQLARESGLYPTYFHKLFTAAYGRTPMQKLNDYRISNATAYLASTTHSISEIAVRCGFTSQNYFTVKFKELTGQTPTQFRKAHQKTK